MSEAQNKFKELEEKLGPGKVYLDRAIRITHRMAHTPEILLHKDRINDFLPDAVVYVTSTDDVVEVVKFANRYKIPLIPQGGRISTVGSQGRRGAIAVSFHRMNRILEFDEENEWVVVEPGVRCDHVGEFLEKRGYCRIEWPLTRTAVVGARVGVDGYNRWAGRWGRSKDTILAYELVLPDGSVAVFGDGGSKNPMKSALGFNLKGLFMGSRGSLGMATKIWIKTPKLPAAEGFGYRAFPDQDDAIRAQIELDTDPITSAWVWRTTQTGRWFLDKREIVTGTKVPEEIQSVLDYNFFGGSKEMLDMVKARIDEITKKHNGFLSDKFPPEEQFGKAAYTNRDLAINVMNTFVGTRGHDGKRGGLWTPVDPAIPNSSAVAYAQEARKLLKTLHEDYPGLKDHAVFLPGTSLNVSINYLFFYGAFVVDVPVWSRDFTRDYVRFYQDHAALAHRFGGTLTYIHGYAPREVEIEMIREEVGEVGYEIMKKIKKTLDPNNIMNPYVRFDYEDDPIMKAIEEGR